MLSENGKNNAPIPPTLLQCKLATSNQELGKIPFPLNLDNSRVWQK